MSYLTTALRGIRQKYARANSDNSDKTPSAPTFGTIGSFVIGTDSEISPGWDATDWQADFEERAAIIEFDGNQPRAAAEAMARAKNRPDPFQPKEKTHAY